MKVKARAYMLLIPSIPRSASRGIIPFVPMLLIEERVNKAERPDALFLTVLKTFQKALRGYRTDF